MEHHTTPDELAQMINTGFTGVTKAIGEVKQDMAEVKHRLGRIEHLLLAEQKGEIEDLQKRMKKLEDAIVVKACSLRPVRCSRRIIMAAFACATFP
jgi:hypothetical protein